MNDPMIDLTVNNWTMQLYELQRQVDEAAPVDAISAPEYRALLSATQDLHWTAAQKYNAYVAAMKAKEEGGDDDA
jgi:hypothetical protein